MENNIIGTLMGQVVVLCVSATLEGGGHVI
jgi:hypothetical protein